MTAPKGGGVHALATWFTRLAAGRRRATESPAVPPKHRMTAKTRSSLHCVGILLAGACLQTPLAQAADPQAYRVDMASTGNARPRFDAQGNVAAGGIAHLGVP